MLAWNLRPRVGLDDERAKRIAGTAPDALLILAQL